MGAVYSIATPNASVRVEVPTEHPIEHLSFVYCVLNMDRLAVKIGYSKSPVRRFSQLQTASCDKLIYCGAFRGGKIAERVWHRRYADRRLIGEWFDNSDGFILRVFQRRAADEVGA